MSNKVVVAARVLDTLLRLRHPSIKTRVLGQEHMVAAAELLSQEFCRREPLCRVLKITKGEIVPFFTQYLAHVAKQRLGIVALDGRGQVVGAITAEDHLAMFTPSGLGVHVGVEAINAFLDLSEVPAEILPQRFGELYYSGLGAVADGVPKTQTLSLMILALFWHVRALGYRHGYAKVTNGAIVRKFQQLENFAKSSVFTVVETSRPADFAFDGSYPFRGYTGTASLVTWPIV